jgi:hypothetical protein
MYERLQENDLKHENYICKSEENDLKHGNYICKSEENVPTGFESVAMYSLVKTSMRYDLSMAVLEINISSRLFKVGSCRTQQFQWSLHM